MSYNYCVDPVGEYVDDTACGAQQFEGGGKDLVLFIDALPADPSDGTEINALITNGSARLVTNVKAGLSAPSAQESTALVACATPTVSTYDRELTITDGKVSSENVLFWNSINASAGIRIVGALIHECAEDRVTFIDKTISFRGGRVLPDNNDADLQRFEMTGLFKSKGDPTIHTMPVGVFPV